MAQRLLTCLLLFLIATFARSTAQKVDKVPIINEHVERTIDLSSTGAVTREVSKVSFKVANTNAGSAEEYLVAIPEKDLHHLASLQVIIDDVRVEFGESWINTTSKLKLFRAKLPRPMTSGSLIVKIAYTHRTKPYPAEIPQGEKQSLEYFGSAYFVTSYPTPSQKTTIKLPSHNVISYSQQPSPASKSSSIITYGPFKDVEGYRVDDLSSSVSDSTNGNIHIHYEDVRPMLVAKNLFRDVWISHSGGKLSVEEHYELVNEGAKLKGHFSRIDYLFVKSDPVAQSRMNVLKGLPLTFPAKASNPYYRDTIGNVSTSNFRNEKSKSVMEIQPRYPVWGGWKYTWYHGYDVPLNGFLRNRGSRYTLAVPFLSSTQNVAYDYVKLRIVLPEGASNVRVAPPFKVDSEKHDRVYWYMDTIGRPAAILEKKNAVDGEHSDVVYISYDYSDMNLFRKPLVATLFFSLLFIVSMIIVRLDFSIIPDENAKRDDVLAMYRRTIGRAHATAIATYKNAVSDYEKARESKRTDDYTSSVRTIDNMMNGLQASLTEAAASVEKFDTPKKLVDGATQLSKIFGEKLQIMRRFHLEVLDTVCKSGEVDERQKRVLQSSLNAYEEKKEQIDDNIKGLVKELSNV